MIIGQHYNCPCDGLYFSLSLREEHAACMVCAVVLSLILMTDSHSPGTFTGKVYPCPGRYRYGSVRYLVRFPTGNLTVERERKERGLGVGSRDS